MENNNIGKEHQNYTNNRSEMSNFSQISPIFTKNTIDKDISSNIEDIKNIECSLNNELQQLNQCIFKIVCTNFNSNINNKASDINDFIKSPNISSYNKTSTKALDNIIKEKHSKKNTHFKNNENINNKKSKSFSFINIGTLLFQKIKRLYLRYKKYGSKKYNYLYCANCGFCCKASDRICPHCGYRLHYGR